MSDLERDLAAYYDQDAPLRAQRTLQPERVRRRDEFVALLEDERRGQLLEVGTGPGVDALAFQGARMHVTGIDLSPEHVAICRDAGLDAQVGSVLALPFADDSFDAGWTMSTLLHVPDARFDDALAELCRVLMPGAPLAIGLWAGEDIEVVSTQDRLDPPRFFSFRSTGRLHSLLAAHGRVERLDTWTDPTSDGTYQWCLLRTP